MKLIILVFGLVLAPLGWSQDLVAGKAAYATCIACHGAGGEGNPALNSPALAGQDAAYLARQLEHFKTGVRGAAPGDVPGAQMRPMAMTLADQTALTNVAAYLASLPVVPVSAQLEGDIRNGENLYNAYCGACHGATAEGNPALNSPRLAGLDYTYLARQLQNYATGIRGADADDRYGRQMAMMSRVLPDENATRDVLMYIVSQGLAE